MRAVGIFLTMFLLAAGANADTFWYTLPPAMDVGPATAIEKATRVAGLRPGQSAYTQSYATTATDSVVLDVTQCKAFTALYYRGGSAAEAHLIDNRVPGVAATGTKILNDSGDLDLTGSAATGLAFIYNVTGVTHIWVDTTTAPAGTDYGTMRITCVPSE